MYMKVNFKVVTDLFKLSPSISIGAYCMEINVSLVRVLSLNNSL